MNQYKIFRTWLSSDLDPIPMGPIYNSLEMAISEAFCYDRISPGIIYSLRIRKRTWWNRLRGKLVFTWWRYSDDQKCFVPLGNEENA
jgi:hypothetical protein